MHEIRAAINGVGFAQPDVTLILDAEGVIQQATLANDVAGEGVEAWLGRAWSDTVGEVGSDKARTMVDDARIRGISAFRQITQRFPSGRELPMEYTLVRLGGRAGLIAIGRNLQAVADLQSRLIAAQEAMERDYWRFRDVETRYRLLFDVSSEPVLLIGAEGLRIAETNPAAIRALGLAPGRAFVPEVAHQDREAFHAMLQRVREHGKAPGLVLHLGVERDPWLVRASMMATQPGAVFLLQLSPASAAPRRAQLEAPSVEALLRRMPDGFVLIDTEGVIQRANPAFAELVQAGAEAAVEGERLGRWLSQPGADLGVLLGQIRRHGNVRLFATNLQGERTEVPVEIAAAGDVDGRPRYVGLLIHDVSGRMAPAERGNGIAAAIEALTRQTGTKSLRRLVQDTTGLVERHYIEAALKLTQGNRTAAADMLGISRQGLYAKLSRYNLDGDASATGDPAS
ncbi:MAG: transcriptional regulator PpsR [Dongiaceae bacterium]